MKYLSLLFGLMFVFFAALQVNDPDPYLWIPVYLFPAFICLAAFRDKFYPILTILFSILCLAGSIWYFPPSVSQWLTDEQATPGWSMKSQGMEEARESLGLLICFASMLFNLGVYSVQKKKFKP